MSLPGDDSRLEEGTGTSTSMSTSTERKISCEVIGYLKLYFFLISYWLLCLLGKPLEWILIVITLPVLVLYEVIKLVIKIMMRHVIKRVVKFAIKKKIFLLLSVLAIVVDPLFFYTPVVDDERKCIRNDKVLGIIATVLRSALDLLKIIHFIFELLSKLRAKRRTRGWLIFVVDISAILPVPQVLVNLRETGGWNLLLQALRISLIQNLLRIIRAWYLFTEATGVSGILAEATWAIIGFNVLLYMQGGHVCGALWYFFAIEKLTRCWKEACNASNNNSRCDYSSFTCEAMTTTRADDDDDYRFYLNDYCDTWREDASSYVFGMYKDAVQSGIVEVTIFPKKLLHGLQWGLQNLSAFGQNLQTGTGVLENTFAICMTNFGVMLFVFLIGKMQSDIARSDKIKQKWKEIKQWPNFGDISSDVRGHIRNYKREKWQETERVDVDNLMNDLPDELANKIKRKLCIMLIKNVEGFENWSQKSLGYLCEFLKPVSFAERTRIIREGDPIDEMLFVLKGKLWTYNTSSRNVTTTATNGGRRREIYLKDGDFLGEELITWAQDESSSGLPVSTKTIQALTDVEAFTLMAVDLKHVLSLRHCDRAAQFLQSYWRFKKFMRERSNIKKKSGLRKVLERVAAELHSNN